MNICGGEDNIGERVKIGKDEKYKYLGMRKLTVIHQLRNTSE